MARDIILAALGAMIAAMIGVMAERFFSAFSSLLGPPVPSGAVVAFGHESCPEGWESYVLGSGRFLLGSGKDYTTGESYELHAEGGIARHPLRIEEMPHHNHSADGRGFLVRVTGRDTVHAQTDETPGEINIRQGLPMVPIGEGKPHENMPPYLVVNFCQKK